MKKYLFLLISLVFAISSCGKKQGNKNSNESDVASESTSETSKESKDASEDINDPLDESEEDESLQSDTFSEPQSEPNEQYSLDDFQYIIDNSRPTIITTTQSFAVADIGITLSFNSRIAIEYGSQIKTSYSYSYEKINEIVTGEEEFISVISGTIYSVDSNVYDGINWVNKVEKSTTMSGVIISDRYGEFDISDFVLNGEIKDDSVVSFFNGVDYGIKDLSFRLSTSDKKMRQLTLNFSAFIESIGKQATVKSTTNYSYDPITVSVPE